MKVRVLEKEDIWLQRGEKIVESLLVAVGDRSKVEQEHGTI